MSILAQARIDIRARACILPPMDQIFQTHERPAGLTAGGAFLCAEAWQSGLSHRAYLPADLWASKPLAGSRPFESDRFHHQTSGAIAVAPVTTPDHQPRDWAPEKTTYWNIRLARRSFQRCPSLITDWARHERSISRPTNPNHRLPH